ncbi:MAG: hypothetical protein WDO24_10935 [Pseudomonadota bacterium]
MVDDGSMALNAPRNQAIAVGAGGVYLFVPGNRGLPTALNCGLSYFLADDGVTWISTFNDDVAVDPALYQVLAKLEATREFPLMTGYLSPHHTVFGTRVVGGHEVQLLRSMPGQHIHAARDYWRGILAGADALSRRAQAFGWAVSRPGRRRGLVDRQLRAARDREDRRLHRRGAVAGHQPRHRRLDLGAARHGVIRRG